jgi:hypothetical protein
MAHKPVSMKDIALLALTGQARAAPPPHDTADKSITSRLAAITDRPMMLPRARVHQRAEAITYRQCVIWR